RRQLLTKGAEAVPLLRGVETGVVGDVVGGAAEGVHRVDGVAPARGQQAEGDVEGPRPGAGDTGALAMPLGDEAAVAEREAHRRRLRGGGPGAMSARSAVSAATARPAPPAEGRSQSSRAPAASTASQAAAPSDTNPAPTAARRRRHSREVHWPPRTS